MIQAIDGSEIPCICVTNRLLCQDGFLRRIRKIAGDGQADVILLREKDMAEDAYGRLAAEVMKICGEFHVPCILHSFYHVAKELGCRRIHVPLGILSEMTAEDRSYFEQVGTSVHSVSQAERAQELGASYLIAGHVFETDCKRGLPGRGLSFIADVSQKAVVPVYGIGGIDMHNARDVMKAGAAGVCMMSGFMT